MRRFSFAFFIVVTNFGAGRMKFNVHKIYMHVCVNVFLYVDD